MKKIKAWHIIIAVGVLLFGIPYLRYFMTELNIKNRAEPVTNLLKNQTLISGEADVRYEDIYINGFMVSGGAYYQITRWSSIDLDLKNAVSEIRQKMSDGGFEVSSAGYTQKCDSITAEMMAESRQSGEIITARIISEGVVGKSCFEAPRSIQELDVEASKATYVIARSYVRERSR